MENREKTNDYGTLLREAYVSIEKLSEKVKGLQAKKQEPIVLDMPDCLMDK